MEISNARKHAFGMKVYRLALAKLARECRRAALTAIDDRRAVNNMTRSALIKYRDHYMTEAVKRGDFRKIRVTANLGRTTCIVAEYFDAEDADERTRSWTLQHPNAVISWDVDLG
jgi:hypothetical protein